MSCGLRAKGWGVGFRVMAIVAVGLLEAGRLGVYSGVRTCWPVARLQMLRGSAVEASSA